ncbi:MAG TPA: competence/damage-inducible protein A [Burkholderiales bacterium]|nr:competence/damage-inducible protein A [Burkholderiales bacterium]
MKTEIIAVGTELLTPFFQDTNSLFLAERLNDLGLSLSFKTIVGDADADLRRAVRTALGRSRLVIAMGGLGPTEDDRTREAFAAVLGRTLVPDARVLAAIRARFRRRGQPMAAANRKQALVIEGAEVLPNPNGTAPGLWLETSRHRIALLPGPPHELRPMFDNHVRPRLAPLGKGVALRRVLRLTGIGESLMESRIRDIYPGVPARVTVTTLAAPGDLAIHLVYHGPGPLSRAASALHPLEKKVLARLEAWIYSTDGSSLEAVVGQRLKEQGLTLACAESCTGGLIGHRLTNIPGSSAYFLESAVVYSNRAKTRRLRVPASLIEKHGAVSAAVARAMAAGVRETAGADFGLAVTGIAGPDGGTPRKPVGLVYMALAGPRGTAVEKALFSGGRELVKFQASQRALNMVRKALIKGRQKNIQ